MKISSSDAPCFLDDVQQIDVPEGVKAVLIEKKTALKCRIAVSKGAFVTHYRLTDGQDDALTADIAEGAEYSVITVRLGSGNSDICVHLNGRHAVCHSDVLYVLNGTDKASVRTDFRHNENETVSNQLIKGAVFEKAKALFEGEVYIPYDKKSVDGSQQHSALLLSDEAEVKAVPKLEIYSDDVKCAHGSAIGSLDAGALYYLQTRGIPLQQAKSMLTQGFLNEILLKIKEDDFKNFLTDIVAQKTRFDT